MFVIYATLYYERAGLITSHKPFEADAEEGWVAELGSDDHRLEARRPQALPQSTYVEG